MSVTIGLFVGTIADGLLLNCAVIGSPIPERSHLGLTVIHLDRCPYLPHNFTPSFCLGVQSVRI
jgi:hypothetical protein